MNVGIEEEKRQTIQKQMNEVLSNLAVLNQKVKKYHWNMKGDRFIMFHELLQEQYEGLDGFMDEVAERVSIMGGEAVGTLEGFLKHSGLKEGKANPTQDKMIQNLVLDYDALCRHTRDSVDVLEEKKDFAGADLCIEILEFLEENAWKLRNHL